MIFKISPILAPIAKLAKPSNLAEFKTSQYDLVCEPKFLQQPFGDI